MRRTGLILICCVMLAGCWEAGGALYDGIKPARPFHAGKIVSHDPASPAEKSHLELTGNTDGSYRLVDTDKTSGDHGDAVVLRVFAVTGLPQGMFLFEAVADDACKAGRTCKTITPRSPRDYGLVRVTATGAEAVSPACAKSGFVARLPGVKADTYDTCRFSSRASLEQAARDQAGRVWKPGVVYRYE